MRTKPSPHRRLQLRDLPLVKKMLGYPYIQFKRRAMEPNWCKMGLVPTLSGGFNLFSSQIFIPSSSPFWQWLDAKDSDERSLNSDDQLVEDLFMAVHDFIHIWSFHFIQRQLTRFQFGVDEVSDSNFDDYAFCFLITETAASVGMDYWFLSQVDLNELCDIGTNYQSFSTSYRESAHHEFKRVNPKLKVRTPKFFEEWSDFNASGELKGYNSMELGKSAMLLKWLRHELEYGETQRSYSRQWVAHLSGRSISAFGLNEKNLTKPFSTKAPWRRLLIKRLGQALWELVHDQNKLAGSPPNQCAQKFLHASKERAPIDFRFTNIFAFEEADLDKIFNSLPKTSATRDYFLRQYVTRYQYKKFSASQIRELQGVFLNQDFNKMKRLCRGLKRISPSDECPEQIFLMA